MFYHSIYKNMKNKKIRLVKLKLAFSVSAKYQQQNDASCIGHHCRTVNSQTFGWKDKSVNMKQ